MVLQQDVSQGKAGHAPRPCLAGLQLSAVGILVMDFYSLAELAVFRKR